MIGYNITKLLIFIQALKGLLLKIKQLTSQASRRQDAEEIVRWRAWEMRRGSRLISRPLVGQQEDG